MSKAKKRVVILFGGRSGEHEVSIVSATSVFRALDRSKYEVTLVGIDKQGHWLLPNETRLLAQSSNPKLVSLNQNSDASSVLPFDVDRKLLVLDAKGAPIAGSEFRADVVIPILHGTNGEDGTLQGLLELANVPYVGSGVLGSALCMDKDVAKRVLRDAGLPIVPFMVAKRHEFKNDAKKIVNAAAQRFGFPFFVKPANLGSSVGVGKIKSERDAIEKIEAALSFDSKVLIEQAIDARELECAVLGNNDPQASVVGEIVPQQEFYSYEAKYVDENGAVLKIPASDIDPTLEARVRKLAVEAFKALECSGMARVDFFLDRKSGELFVNELNTIPGFTPISMYPKLWEASGLSYSKLLDRLIELALERHAERAANKTSY
jgi:D-alanine-D-alanine ligase